VPIWGKKSNLVKTKVRRVACFMNFIKRLDLPLEAKPSGKKRGF
jgi:hypothetical protein